MILNGDGLHNLTKSILIAEAFLFDLKLGIITTISITAHELLQ
tara:strand:- start:97 stop:225 length:129 start_codon:yes stop_codon:yes gene_type:complete